MNKSRLPAIQLILVIMIIIGIEAFSRHGLFHFMSYYNYDAIDWQMQDFKKGSINTVFIGSSEVRYGFDPETFNQTFTGKIQSFNLGIDGMNLSYYRLLLPYLPLATVQPGIRYAIIGMNVAEDVRLYPTAEQGGIDCDTEAGSLQKGVFTSDFAIDSKLINVCHTTKSTLKNLKMALLSASYALEHKKTLRSFILHPWHKKLTREQLNQTNLGFHVRPPAESQASLDNEFADWWKNEGASSTSLDSNLFSESLADGGLYMWYVRFFREHKIIPIFVSLPTNPRMLTLLERTNIYQERSAQLKKWALKNNVIYIDLGLKTDYDPVKDFADRRHLSHFGAEKFSKELALFLKEDLK